MSDGDIDKGGAGYFSFGTHWRYFLSRQQTAIVLDAVKEQCVSGDEILRQARRRR
jgi:hypothetical protein